LDTSVSSATILPLALAGGDVHADAAQRVAPRGGALVAQLLQAHDAALRARAARLDALADPDFFLRQQLVGLGVDHRLLRSCSSFSAWYWREVAGIGKQRPRSSSTMRSRRGRGRRGRA
jgi:hypothetical protein